jgi:CHAT domain-containing protein
MMRKQIHRNFGIMSANQREDYLFYNDLDIIMDTFYPLTAAYPTHETQSISYNNALFSKGLLLRSANEVREAILSSGNQELINQYENLKALRQQITALQTKNDEHKKEYIESLENRADSLDKVITVASSAYRNMNADLNMEWKEVQKNLSNNELAVEFIDYQKFNIGWTDTTLYAALLVRKDWEAPLFVPLFEKSQIDSLLADNNPNLDKRIAKLYNGGNPRFYNGQKLYQLLWQPLEKYLSGIKTVYYSPSGLLNQISFAAIPVDTVLLSDKYDLHLVSSTREVVREKKNKEAFLPVKQSVEYGGIFYDVDNAQELQTAARSYKNASDPVFASHSLPEDATRSGWDYLQGAENEVKEIEAILQNSKVPNIKYMGVSANEESFKSLSGHSPELLHIATHGFFLQDEKEIRQTGFMQMLGNENRSFVNPLLRSGLLFAGANRAWKSENIIPDIEDGILTAEEISQLNLSNSKLVVLSACETALGEVQNSEGVFGLQRAFKLAGVETLVMSLWKVDDAATKDFMITFYQNLMEGKSKLHSFKTAQHFVRGKYHNPYYWAAFVMMD